MRRLSENLRLREWVWADDRCLSWCIKSHCCTFFDHCIIISQSWGISLCSLPYMQIGKVTRCGDRDHIWRLSCLIISTEIQNGQTGRPNDYVSKWWDTKRNPKNASLHELASAGGTQWLQQFRRWGRAFGVMTSWLWPVNMLLIWPSFTATIRTVWMSQEEDNERIKC